MKLSPEEINFIVSRIHHFFPDKDYQILLFGSYSKGKANKSSDVDIAIKAKKPLSPAKWQLLEEDLGESSFLKDVEIIDYQRVAANFKAIIDREGQILFPG